MMRSPRLIFFTLAAWQFLSWLTPCRADAPTFTHQDLARDSIILDLHSDALDKIYKSGGNVGLFGTGTLQTGLPNLKKGGVKAQFFAIWERPGDGIPQAEIMIGLFYQMIARYSRDLAFAGSIEDLERNAAAGKISAFLAIEGGEAIGKDLNKLDYFFQKGVRYMTLTWNHTNLIADAAKDARQPYRGLSPFGRQVVARMNKLGMMVDVSHTSARVVKDVLAISKAPIIASHSDAASLCPSPRNLSDQLIREICSCDGVIGVNYYSPFLVSRGRATVKDVANHIDRMVKVGGIDCVALGSDFDGDIIAPIGLQNAGQLGNLTAELIRRGYTREQIEKIYWRNVARVLRETMGK